MLELSFEDKIEEQREGKGTLQRRKMKEKEEMMYLRLRNSIQYHVFRVLQVGQCVKGPEKGRKRSMWIRLRLKN